MATTEPAIRKVLAALAAALTGKSAATIYVDRPDDEPFGNAELPAINIRVITVEYETLDQGTTLHRARIDFDIATARTVAVSIAAEQSELAAVIVETLHADRSLGGRLQTIVEQSTSGTEDDGAEAGVAILSTQALFCTPVGNHRTIIGQSGQQF